MLSAVTSRAAQRVTRSICGTPSAALRFFASQFKQEYDAHVAERAKLGTAEPLVPQPLSAKFCSDCCELLKDPPEDEGDFLVDLITNRVPPGVDDASYVKASFLAAIAKGEEQSPLITKERATELLGTMLGGYNVSPLVDLLEDDTLSPIAANGLSKTLLMFDAKHDVHDKAKNGNKHAEAVIKSWAEAEWFTSRDKVPECYSVTVFKVTGETNTDDLSPAQDAPTRPDIPNHALAMHKNERDGIIPDVPGSVGPMKQLAELKTKGFKLTYVGDVVGTGSSRKSGVNSVLWHVGDQIPYVPNKHTGSVTIGATIAPIYFNTLEDAGALPVVADDVTVLNMGDVIDVYPYKRVICKHGTDEVLTKFTLKTEVLLDSVQAGGRMQLIIGRGLTNWAREMLGLPPSTAFRPSTEEVEKDSGMTLAQKMVAKASGLNYVKPGMYVEPKMTTVGSQDTTGPMTRDELKDLACLGFSADLVMQSFCHTSAYPKPIDVVTHHTLPDFIRARGGVSLRPGDGIIHSWLNRMLLPDTVGTGGDSHTRFPIGISFPAGSGAVAFAAATGIMPLDLPESILVRFSGEMQPGITLRDLVHAIPLEAIKQGDLTVPKKGKKNIFAGRVLEIEGLESKTCEQAFELSDASAERSAAGCAIRLNKEPIAEYLSSNIVMLKWMVAEGYGDPRTLMRRVASMEAWLENPVLMEPDKDAVYKKIYEIDISQIHEPILCCPNDPDDAKTLADVAGVKIDEVFVGSCMTNIGHFRAAGELLRNYDGENLPTRFWIAPPTKMDEKQLNDEGYYSIFGKVGVRTEMPGCSLCMGNQARVNENATVVSTSTRNFPNRLGQGSNVYLSSAELAAIAAILGRIPTREEYLTLYKSLVPKSENVYRYLNFHKAEDYVEAVKEIAIDPDVLENQKKQYADFVA
jgi:aconitate hydratase 2/2-methylisocitrate dehydratase